MKTALPILLFLFFIPYSAMACFAGPEPSPLGDFSHCFKGVDWKGEPCASQPDKENIVWQSMKYVEIAPNHWKDDKTISSMYFSVKVENGGVGSCGPTALYIYRSLLLPIGLVVLLILMGGVGALVYFKKCIRN